MIRDRIFPLPEPDPQLLLFVIPQLPLLQKKKKRIMIQSQLVPLLSHPLLQPQESSTAAVLPHPQPQAEFNCLISSFTRMHLHYCSKRLIFDSDSFPVYDGDRERFLC